MSVCTRIRALREKGKPYIPTPSGDELGRRGSSVNTPTKIQRTPLSKRSTGSLLLTFIAALFGAIGLLLVAVERTDAQAQGEVWAWGLNGAGQLGDGTTTLQRNTPVQTSGLSGVQSIGSGLFHSLALKNDGTVWAWGFNGTGQLGDGTTTQRNTPVQVSGLSGVQDIAGGGQHSLAAGGDNTSPKVIGTSPKAEATEVAPTANIWATFSEEMDRNTINGTTFKLFKKGTTTQIAAQVSYNADTDTAKLNPINNLRRGVAYKAVVTTWAKDLAGNRLDQNPSLDGLQKKVWFFEIDD
jgi:alpha-tubulin suppressor-like RCC1 family protein